MTVSMTLEKKGVCFIPEKCNYISSDVLVEAGNIAPKSWIVFSSFSPMFPPIPPKKLVFKFQMNRVIVFPSFNLLTSHL